MRGIKNMTWGRSPILFAIGLRPQNKAKGTGVELF